MEISLDMLGAQHSIILFVAMLKGADSLLRDQINEGLRRLEKEGAYAEIISRWPSVG